MLRTKSLVVGSTGLIGSSIVTQLLEKEESVIALVRTNKTSTNSLLDFHKVNFDDLKFPNDFFSDVKDLFICLGTTIKKAGSEEAFQKVDVTYCMDIAQKARLGGVTNLSIVTSVGSDLNSKNFYLKSKGFIERQILELDFESISIYRPGLLIGPRDEFRLGEFIGQKILPFLIDPLLIGSLRKYRSINGDRLAKAMINLSGEEGVNYYYFDDFIKNLKTGN
tara:strand:- start:123 stop:788 length:666 start_codon:yes stop_codon:yes gene_type:complete